MANENTLSDLLKSDGPTCLVIKANLKPVGDLDRFQPTGFPEIGHVIYDAPRPDSDTKTGNSTTNTEKVCIIDSAASMANHLEAVCMDGPNSTDLHPDLAGLPYVICVTDSDYKQTEDSIIIEQADQHDRAITTTLTEGHRIASDYFLDALYGELEWRPEAKKSSKTKELTYWQGQKFRDKLKKDFSGIEIKKKEKDGKKGKKEKGGVYLVRPDDWWKVYQTIFKYDPNSLVHGVMFAKEQIKISRFLTAHNEAFGAKRWGSSGVKFDRLGKTLSGQPIFAVDEETAREIRATFILDLSLLRSYGRNGQGLNDTQKQVLLGLAFWKIRRLLAKPFRFRSGCYLKCYQVSFFFDDEPIAEAAKQLPPLCDVNMQELIAACEFGHESVTKVYYPANLLYKLGKDGKDSSKGDNEDADGDANDEMDDADADEDESSDMEE